MRFALPMLILFWGLAGCSRQPARPSEGLDDYLLPTNLPSMRRERLDEPMVAVVALDATRANGLEAVHYHPLNALPLSVRGKFSSYEGFGLATALVYLSLFERRPDPDVPGNLLLKFEVLYQQEILDVPLVSWNQEDELDLLAGGNWLVKLTRHKLVSL